VSALTTLSPPTPAEEDAILPPLPWRRMLWVSWRQHRIALAGVATLLGASAAYLWLAGLKLHHAYAAAIACHPAASVACTNMTSDFSHKYDHTATLIPALLQAIPALIGAFVGAPVLARELETGTFRYAWTQGFGRWRWTLAKLVTLAVAVAAATGVFGLLFTWYYRPFIADGQNGPLAGIVFDLRAIAFPAWTLAAFAIGALSGTLIRRVIPAIVTTLATYVALAVAVAVFLRQYYVTPLVSTSLSVPGSAWIYSRWATKGGTFAFAGRPPLSVLNRFCAPSGVQSGKPSTTSIDQCLSQHGYTMWTRYQPASRFWTFQWIEGSWLLALSVLLIAATVWRIRRRAA
jgi:hypothetical protein